MSKLLYGICLRQLRNKSYDSIVKPLNIQPPLKKIIKDMHNITLNKLLTTLKKFNGGCYQVQELYYYPLKKIACFTSSSEKGLVRIALSLVDIFFRTIPHVLVNSKHIARGRTKQVLIVLSSKL